MALSTLAPRQASCRPAVCRPRTVRVAAVHHPHASSPAFVASAAAALLLCSPVFAAPLNPVMSELASNPVKKALNKLDSLDPPKGVKGPEVEGQFRSNPDKARALAAENAPGVGKCGCTGAADCQCTPGQCP